MNIMVVRTKNNFKGAIFMNTDNASCALNKKCREKYSNELAEKLSKEEDNLEELYKKEEVK